MRTYDLSGLRAVAVDDDPHMRTILRVMLQSCGIRQIELATCGKDGFELIQAVKPDFVITDWQMRGGDGIELVRRVRNDPDSFDRFLPVVMLSSHAEMRNIHIARDAGVTNFLAKPISGKRLLHRINTLIEDKRPFVETENFFGPCRRWRTDPSQAGNNKRTVTPKETPLSEAEIEPAEDGLDLVFEDVPSGPRLFRPPNKMMAKLGGRRAPDPSVLLAQVERGVMDLKQKFVSWANADLSTLYNALEAAREHLGTCDGEIVEVREIAHNMRGQAGTFDYPLITEIGNSLYKLTEGAAEFGSREIEAVELHVQAIDAIVSRRIEGRNHAQAREMIEGLRTVTSKYAA